MSERLSDSEFHKAMTEFTDAAFLAGARDRRRVVSSATLAIGNGQPWRKVLESLFRNCPSLWDRREALRRQRKAELC